MLTVNKDTKVPFTTLDILKPRHIKPQTNITKTHQTSDKENRAANYTTDKIPFHISIEILFENLKSNQTLTFV